VESHRTATVGIVVNVVAVDLNLFAYAVEDATLAVILALEQLSIASSDRIEITGDSLVSKKVAIGSNREVVTLKEAVQLFDRPAGRILLQLGQEAHKRHRAEARITELKDAVNAERVDGRATKVDCTILNLDIIVFKEVLSNSLLRGKEAHKGIPIFLAVSLNGLTKQWVVITHCVLLGINNHGQGTAVFLGKRQDSRLDIY
jgi:hypothetical protein